MNMKEQHEMTQAEVAEAMFLCKDTIMKTEKRALEKLRKALDERGIKLDDLLKD